jgi:hypothetical protein
MRLQRPNHISNSMIASDVTVTNPKKLVCRAAED